MRLLAFLIVTLLITNPLLADVKSDITDLDDRLFALEESLQGKNPVSPIDAKTLRIGGTIYHDQRYAISSADGYDKSLTSTTRMDLLMAGEVGKNVDYIFVPSWFFLSPRANMDAANRSSEGERQTMSLIYRLNMSYKFTGNHSMTIGRFIAPFSSYVDTYSPSADNMSYWPQMVIPMGGVTFTPVMDGLMYKGQSFFSGWSWKYKLYVALHATDGGAMSTNVFQKYLLNGTPNKHHYGFRSVFSLWNSKIQIGLSGQFGERFYGTDAMTKDGIYRKFAVYGADLNINLGKFKIRSEYMKTNEGSVQNGDPANINAMMSSTSNTGATIASMNTLFRNFMASYLDSNKTSYYVEGSYRFNSKLMVALRYDYADFKTLLFHHGKAKKILGASINYFPVDKFMLRLGIDKHDYDADKNDISNGKNPFDGLPYYMGGQADAQANPDYMEYSLSATLSF